MNGLKHESYMIKNVRKLSGRWRVFALITKGGRPLVSASNYLAQRGHCAERRCLQRFKGNLIGARIYIVRITQGEQTLGLAHPCPLCLNSLRARGIKKVYYSVRNDEWAEMRLDLIKERS